MQETWKSIPGHEEYEASDCGQVRKTSSGRIKRPFVVRGYHKIHLHGKDAKCTGVHRLVASAFLGRIPDGLQVNHKNGVKTDNRPENLEYVTGKENIRHACSLGLIDRQGENNRSAKLTTEQVGWVRRIYRHGKTTYRQLGECFSVSEKTIGSIVTGHRWKMAG